jgi:hypothetical protein
MTQPVRYALAITVPVALGLGLLWLANVAYWRIVEPMADEACPPRAFRVGERITTCDNGFFYRAGAAYYSLQFLILVLGALAAVLVVRKAKVPWPVAGLPVVLIAISVLYTAALGEFTSACLLGRSFFSHAIMC